MTSDATSLAARLRSIHQLMKEGLFEDALSSIEQLDQEFPGLNSLTKRLRKNCTGANKFNKMSYGADHDSEWCDQRAALYQLKPFRRRIKRMPNSDKMAAAAKQQSKNNKLFITKTGLLDQNEIDDDWLSGHTVCSSHHIETPAIYLVVDSVRYCKELSIACLEGWCLRGGQALESVSLITKSKNSTIQAREIKLRERPDLAKACVSAGLSKDQWKTAGFSLVFLLNDSKKVRNRVGIKDMIIVWSQCKKNGEKIEHLHNVGDIAQPFLPNEAVHQALDCLVDDSLQITNTPALLTLSESWSKRCAQNVRECADHHQYNEATANPELSIVIPLYGRVDFMEYQLCFFNALAQRQWRGILFPYQIIYVLDDPSMKDELIQLARRCEILFSIPFLVVTGKKNLGFAGANNLGVSFSAASWLLFMNSDVIPVSDVAIGSMLELLRQYSGEIGAVGGHLKYENGAVQHIGMEFVKQSWHQGLLADVWLNNHPFKGVRMEKLPASLDCIQEVEAATAACLMMSSDIYRKVGGFSTEYIIGDFEDSDLCLKIRAKYLRIAVSMEGSFYHLERQSMGLGIAASSATQKLVAANAYLHHLKWSETIEWIKQNRLEA